MRNISLKKKDQIIAFVLVLWIALLSGCEKVKISSAPNVGFSEVSSDFTMNQLEETQKPPEETADKNTVSEENKTTVTKKQNTKTESKTCENSSQSKSEQGATEISSSQNQETDASTENKPLESEPISKNAASADARAIADKLIGHINEYRISQGVPAAVVLEGLTEYAEYRSWQLVTNFAHDTKDERVAAKALQYGKVIIPSEYGLAGDSYYVACASEAIAQAGYTGSIEYIAQKFATLAKNSPGHWSYVGNAEYPYMAVGITFDSGIWYCDIAMSMINEYEK